MNEPDKKRLFEQMYQVTVDERDMLEKYAKDHEAVFTRWPTLFCEIKEAGLIAEYLSWKREEHGRSKGGQADQPEESVET